MEAEAGGREVVLALFEQYYERVYVFARRSLDAQSAEDIAQEVFMRLLKISGITEMSINCSYLIKIADNLIKRRYRRERQFGSYAAQLGESEPVPGRRQSSEMFAAEEVASPERLGALPVWEQDVVRLIVCGGLSYRQAADAMGAKVSEVNNWKFRGIRRLREHVEADATRRCRGAHQAAAPGRDASGEGTRETAASPACRARAAQAR